MDASIALRLAPQRAEKLGAVASEWLRRQHITLKRLAPGGVAPIDRRVIGAGDYRADGEERSGNPADARRPASNSVQPRGKLLLELGILVVVIAGDGDGARSSDCLTQDSRGPSIGPLVQNGHRERRQRSRRKRRSI